MYFYFISLHVSSITVLIIRRSNCINTSSGMISLYRWLLGMPVRRELPPDRHTKQSLTQANHTRWCINTIQSPDDEHCDARNMQGDEINTWKSVPSWLLARICNEMHGQQNIKIWHQMLMSGQLHALSTLYLGIRISVTTGQKLDELQSQAQCYEDKISTLSRSQTQLSCY